MQMKGMSKEQNMPLNVLKSVSIISENLTELTKRIEKAK